MGASGRGSWELGVFPVLLVTGLVACGADHDLMPSPSEPLHASAPLPIEPEQDSGTAGDGIVVASPPLAESESSPSTEPQEAGTTPRAAALEVHNPDPVPAADWLVFSAFGSKKLPHPYQPRSRVALRLANVAGAEGPLTVESLVIDGPWTVVAPTALPVVLAPGESTELQLEFAATGAKKVWRGSLAIHSSDTAQPVRTLQLAGIWMVAPEGNNELSFAEGMKVFPYSTAFVHAGETLNNQGRIETAGEEVLVPVWERADASRPVHVRQLAAFRNFMRPEPAVGAYFEWEDLSGGVDRGPIQTLFITENKDCQRVLPRMQGSELPAEGYFSPPGPFRFMIDGVASSDPARFYAEYPQYFPNCQGACGHTFRVFPLKDASGAVVPSAYIMTMDFAGGNYDYNDNTYLLENVQPASGQTP